MSQYRPPSPNWADGSTRSSGSGGWVAPMIVGAALFAVGCGSGLVVGWMGGFMGSAARSFADLAGGAVEPFDGTVGVAMPEKVVAGQPFDLVVTITDTRGEARTLQFIDFSGDLASRCRVISIDPTPDRVSIDPDYREHAYQLPVAPNGSVSVTFTLQADQAGPIEALFEVYLDEYNSQTHFETISVE